ncbi:tyrosine-protein phosphatase [Atopobiaceae bacterium 24-176]
MGRQSGSAPDVREVALERRFAASDWGYMGLTGVRNARDLGGLATSDGHVVARGRLLRSGELHGASVVDARALADLGLSAVVDFRTERERSSAPDPAALFPGVDFEFVPVISASAAGITRSMDLRDLLSLFREYERGAEDRMSEMYAEIVTGDEGRAGYHRFFNIVMEAGERPRPSAVLWHCSAGKDRTGIAAALLEHALGVPEELVVEDFLASNRFTQPGWAKAVLALGDRHLFPSKVAAMVHVLYTVEEQSLRRAFDAVRKGWGSVDAYLDRELGMDAERVQRLRELFLERPTA